MTLTDCYTAIKICEENVKDIDNTLEMLNSKTSNIYKNLEDQRNYYLRHINNLSQKQDKILNGIFLEAMV